MYNPKIAWGVDKGLPRAARDECRPHLMTVMLTVVDVMGAFLVTTSSNPPLLGGCRTIRASGI